MDGTYQEGSISFANSGTASNPITIKAQNKWGAVLSSVSGDSPAISINRSYITIQDLRISVSPNNSSSGVASSADCAIRAFESNEPTMANPTSGVVGLTARGLLIGYSAQRTTGIKSNQDFTLIENCEVHSALELYNNKDSIVRNNVVYGNDSWGDSFTSKSGVRNLQVYGNTFHMTDPNGRGLVLGGNSGTAWAYDPSTVIEAYDSIAHDNTIINETGTANPYVMGLTGTQNCTLRDNVIIGGGQIFQTKGGAASGGPQPMPVDSTIMNNTFM